MIPANRLNPQAVAFARLVPDPNTPAGTFSWAPVRELDTDQVTVRIDQTLSNSTRIFGRYSFHDQRQSDPNAYPALGNAPLSTRGQNVVLSMSNTLKSSLLHDVRFSYVPSVVDLEAFLQGQNPYDALGIRGFEETERPGVGGSFPDFAWSGYTAMNGSAFDQRPKTQDLKVYEISDNLTWVKGRHIVKFGGKYRRWEPLFTDSKQYAGQWNYDGSLTQNAARTAGTGDAFADFLLGYPRSVTRAFPADVFGGQANYWHGYVQDDFKVSNRLTVNVGPALRVLAVAVRLPRPGRHLPAGHGAPDRGRRRGDHAGPRRAVRRRVGLRALRQPDPDQQPGRPARIDHRDRSGAVRPARRLRVAAVRREDRGPRRLRAVLRAGELGRSRQQQRGAVPPRSDGVQRPDAAGADDGRLLPGHEPRELGGADDRRGRARAEDGPRPPLQRRRAAAGRAVHRRRAELRRQHRQLPQRHHQHQHPGARRRRHPGEAAVPDLRQHLLLRRLARHDLPLAAGLGRAAHARRPVLPRRRTRGRRA